MSRTPEGPPPPPTVQRLRIQYSKSGPLRFTSHRDFARAFERALRRAEIPMAYSAGFSPHPKISYAGAAPTGVSSHAEYLEIGLATVVDPEQVKLRLDSALPAGLDIVLVVPAFDPKAGLTERLEVSRWEILLDGVDETALRSALESLIGLETAEVERATKDGRRRFDVLPAVITAEVAAPSSETLATRVDSAQCAILHLVVRHTIPAVRPDDIVAALREHAGLSTPGTVKVTRMAQGRMPEQSVLGDSATTVELIDPLAGDVAAAQGQTG